MQDTNSDIDNPYLKQIADLLTDMELTFHFDEQNNWLNLDLTTPEGYLCPLIIMIQEGYWMCLLAWGLNQNPLVDDSKLCKFYKELLKINTRTNIGKFSINEHDFLEFSVDIRLQDLNQNLLNEAINLTMYCVNDRLPEIAEPYVSLLFQQQ